MSRLFGCKFYETVSIIFVSVNKATKFNESHANIILPIVESGEQQTALVMSAAWRMVVNAHHDIRIRDGFQMAEMFSSITTFS